MVAVWWLTGRFHKVMVGWLQSGKDSAPPPALHLSFERRLRHPEWTIAPIAEQVIRLDQRVDL